MTRPRQLFAASAALAASLALAGCKAKEQGPGGNPEMKVEQTPVSSLYDEKGGVLYERPARTPTATSPPSSTPSPLPRS